MVEQAWMSPMAMVRLALGLRQCLTPAGAGAGLWLFVVWAIGVIICGLFPPDPPGHWDEPPSVSGMIHGVVALIALAALARPIRRLGLPSRRRAGAVAAASLLLVAALLA